MPIYEYECKKCGKVFEKLVKNSEEKVVCAECGNAKLKKLFSSFSAIGDSSESSCSFSNQCTDTCCPTCPTGSCPMAPGI